MDYKQQLADSRWLKKKNEILERDNYTCQHCGRTSNLNVHHLNYEKGKLAWEYPNEKLITLCVDCHENEHNIVTYPKIGKFYTYHHSDYWNDMICFYIDRKRNQIGLFGVDCGGYGTAYIDFVTFDFFYTRCRNSDIHFNLEDEECNTYTTGSFYEAYNNLMSGSAFIDGAPFHLQEQTLSFAQRKVKEVIETRQDILDAFEQIKFWEDLK
jgi:hypothetical protein